MSEELTQAGDVQTLRHQDPRFHLSHRRYDQVPPEVPSFRGGTTTTRIRDPKSVYGVGRDRKSVVHHTFDCMV